MLRPLPAACRGRFAANWLLPLQRQQQHQQRRLAGIFHNVKQVVSTIHCGTFHYSEYMTPNCRKVPLTSITIPKLCRPLVTTASSRKRRRRPKQIVTAPTSSTTKDRMRRLVETNQFPPSPPVAQQLNEMLDVATGRLTWLRDTVFQTWNPDYNNSGGSSSRSQQQRLQELQLEGSETTLPKQDAQRPPWRPPDMDARWWFWNLVWALLPAICIALYCEFRGKPRMLAYRRQRELEELQQIMGKDAVTEEMVQGNLQTSAAARAANESFWERMDRIGKELTIWWQGGDSSTPDDEKEIAVASHPPGGKTVNRSPKGDHAPICKPPAEPEPGVVMEMPSAQHKEHTTAIATPGLPDNPRQPQYSFLLQRIEQLEAIVQRQEEHRQRELQRQLDRLRSSGIHNRAMQDRGVSPVTQTSHKVATHGSEISSREQIGSKNETALSVPSVVWENISKMVDNVHSVAQHSIANRRQKNSRVDSEDGETRDKLAKKGDSAKYDNQDKESSTACTPTPDDGEHDEVEKLESSQSSEQVCLTTEDTKKIERRPWWKLW